MKDKSVNVRRLNAAIIAGTVAIIINTLALKAADLVPLATAKGGLLRLVTPLFAPILQWLGLSSMWITLGGPAPGTEAFKTGFHLAVGIAMAVFYAFVAEPFLPTQPNKIRDGIVKGLISAISVWLLNAIVVLPLTDEGFAGSAHLSFAGMAWYAAAHTLFFVLLSVGFTLLTVQNKKGSPHRA